MGGGDLEEKMIDEQSPDEDERQAMQNLRAPIRRKAKRIIHSGLSSKIYILYLLFMVNLNIEIKKKKNHTRY